MGPTREHEQTSLLPVTLWTLAFARTNGPLALDYSRIPAGTPPGNILASSC